MSLIYVNATGFPATCPIVKVNEDGTASQLARVEFKALQDIVPDYCYNHNCEKILIDGATPFVEELKYAISSTYKTKFSKSIEIEVVQK